MLTDRHTRARTGALDVTMRHPEGSGRRIGTGLFGLTHYLGRDLVQVVTEHLRTRRVTELRHRLALDLPDALTGDTVDLADLV